MRTAVKIQRGIRSGIINCSYMVGVTTKTFRATHTKHDGPLEPNSHNILQTHGKRTLGRMHNKETSKIYYTKPLLRSGWIGAGLETGEDDCAKKRNTIMDPWQSYDRANHCPTDKVMYKEVYSSRVNMRLRLQSSMSKCYRSRKYTGRALYISL